MPEVNVGKLKQRQNVGYSIYFNSLSTNSDFFYEIGLNCPHFYSSSSYVLRQESEIFVEDRNFRESLCTLFFVFVFVFVFFGMGDKEIWNERTQSFIGSKNQIDFQEIWCQLGIGFEMICCFVIGWGGMCCKII